MLKGAGPPIWSPPARRSAMIARVAIAAPIELVGKGFDPGDQIGLLGDVVADRDVHLVERRTRSVVQRVVEIEKPDRPMLFQRERIIVPINDTASSGERRLDLSHRSGCSPHCEPRRRPPLSSPAPREGRGRSPT